MIIDGDSLYFGMKFIQMTACRVLHKSEKKVNLYESSMTKGKIF